MPWFDLLPIAAFGESAAEDSQSFVEANKLAGEGTQRRSSDAVLEGIKDLIQLNAAHAKERHEEIKTAIAPLAGIDLKQLSLDVKRHNELESTYRAGKRFLRWFIPIGASLGLWNWKWLAAVLHVKELGQ